MRWDRLATCAEQSINLPTSCRFWWQLSQHYSWFLLLSFQYLSLTSVHPFFLWPATQITVRRRWEDSDRAIQKSYMIELRIMSISIGLDHIWETWTLTSSSDSPRFSVSRFKATSRFATTTQTASKMSVQSASNSIAASKITIAFSAVFSPLCHLSLILLIRFCSSILTYGHTICSSFYRNNDWAVREQKGRKMHNAPEFSSTQQQHEHTDMASRFAKTIEPSFFRSMTLPSRTMSSPNSARISSTAWLPGL